jgi:hypothetical protein
MLLIVERAKMTLINYGTIKSFETSEIGGAMRNLLGLRVALMEILQFIVPIFNRFTLAQCIEKGGVDCLLAV